MRISWEIRYEEQISKLRLLVKDLQNLCDMKERLGNGLRRLFANQNVRALLCVEGVNTVPAILLDKRPELRIHSDATSDPQFGGIAPGAAAVLRSTRVGIKSLKQLARLTPHRQEEVAWLMIASGCSSEPFVNALVFATDPSLLALCRSHPRLPVDPAKREAANREISMLSRHLEALAAFTNSDLLALMVGCRYATKVLQSRKVVAYLCSHERETLAELRAAVQRYWNCAFVQFGRN
jgi:hypothetical protein